MNGTPVVRRCVMQSRVSRQYFGVHEVAEILGLHWKTVQLMFTRGILPGQKIGKAWKASAQDIRRYVQAQRQKTAVGRN